MLKVFSNWGFTVLMPLQHCLHVHESSTPSQGLLADHFMSTWSPKTFNEAGGAMNKKQHQRMTLAGTAVMCQDS